MDLKSGYPFWPIKDGIPQSYLPLRDSIEVDIAILGGGISGALTARAFARDGLRVAVIDKRQIAHGSTSASTALLQYEIDTPLSELRTMIGKEDADRAYRICGDAIATIGRIASEYDGCSFQMRPSIYLAAKERDLEFLKEELAARKGAGFDVSFLSKRTLKDEYAIDAEGAIQSELGGQVDAYSLTHSILKSLKEAGHLVFERTPVKTISTDEGVRLTTSEGHTIRAKKLIFAAGYESQQCLKEKVVTLKSSYAFVTEPMPEKSLWKDTALLWDTAEPYLYVRTTSDNRILMGGEDIVFRNAFLRDALIPWKARKLKKKFNHYVPSINVEPAYSWAGTFGETEDGLAYIGESPEWRNSYFNLGFGGNGITYSAIGAELILKTFRGEKPDDLRIFRFGR